MNNFLNFINSKTVAEYYKQLNIKFTAEEKAYLIWISRNTTIAERHDAWEWLISTEEVSFKLKNIIKKCISEENELIKDFHKRDDKSFYTISYYERGNPNKIQCNSIYDTIEICLHRFGCIESNITAFEKLIIRKNFFRGSTEEFIEFEVTANGDVLRFSMDFLNSENCCHLTSYGDFSEMNVQFPSPFVSGDIVRYFDDSSENAFVLDIFEIDSFHCFCTFTSYIEALPDIREYYKELLKDRCPWIEQLAEVVDSKNGREICILYKPNIDYNSFWDDVPICLLLENCESELKEDKKMLKTISSYFRNENTSLSKLINEIQAS